MSAWLDLIWSDGSDEHLELCNAALVDVQTTYAGRLAARTRHVTKRDYSAVLAAYGTTYANAWRNAREGVASEIERGFSE